MSGKPTGTPVAPGAPGLDRLERWMLTVVTHPEGVEAGWAAAVEGGLLPEGVSSLEQVVPGNDRLTPTEQLEVYAYAYFARLVDILIEEYPATRRLLGEDDFEDACRHFLVAHPSSTWTLNKLSLGLAPWLATEGERLDIPRLRAAASVARVERALEEVWDEPYEDGLDPDELAAVPPEGWAELPLSLIRACQLLELDHAVGPFLEAYRLDEDWELPPADASWMLVYRQGTRRFRVPLRREQFDLLTALRCDATTLGAAIEGAATAEGADVQLMLRSLGAWLQDWAASGILRTGA